MTVSARLRELADQATGLGAWTTGEDGVTATLRDSEGNLARFHRHNRAEQAGLAALAPELAVWAAEAADVLDEYDAQCECGTCTKNAALLARLAGIVGADE